LINLQPIVLKIITDFLLEKGDNGLGFLTFKNNPSIKLLDAAPVNVRKVLTQELMRCDNKGVRCIER
jgi:hypothetical protein